MWVVWLGCIGAGCRWFQRKKNATVTQLKTQPAVMLRRSVNWAADQSEHGWTTLPWGSTKTLICICKLVDSPTLPHKPAVFAAMTDLFRPFYRSPGSSVCNLCGTKFKASNMSACSWCFQTFVSQSVPAAGVVQQTASVSYEPAGFFFDFLSPLDLTENCMTLIQMNQFSVITVFFSLSDMWLSYKGECICNRCL